MPTPEIIPHGTELSGHVHRVELLLRMLGLPYRYVAAPASVRCTSALADSNAILVYLAKRYAPGSHGLPEEPVAAARVQRWLSIAAGEVMYGPAIARMVTQWNLPGDLKRAKQIAAVLLRFMNEHLKTRTFLAADHATIADLACYSYVRHAPEGGMALDPYESVLSWLRRVEGLAHFKPIPPSPLPAAT
jgi:glutathione S-transferase